MSNNVSASLQTLPIELLYHIFDNLDIQTIVLSLRQVCRLFRSVIQTYNRYVFDFQWISKFNFNLICRIIPPENVISIILNNDKIPGQADLFLSLVRIRQFTRLHSLTLVEIDESHVNTILKRINIDRLRSFAIKMKKYDERRKKTTVKLLSSIITQSNLWKLDLQIETDRLCCIQWLNNCMIRHLIINGNITFNNLCTIIQCSPYLQTLTLRHALPNIKSTTISTVFSQLISLTIDQIHTTIDQLESLLSLTPSLVHLKMIVQVNILDGKRWEQFIQIHLPMMNKFEIFLSNYKILYQNFADLELIIAPFRSLFWIEHKKWFFTCEYKIDNSNMIYLYTIPICIRTIEYMPYSHRISLSTISNPSTMDNVESITVSLTKALADEIEEKETMMMCPLFLRATKLSLDLTDDCPFIPLNSLSFLVDLSQLVEIEFKNCYSETPNTNALTDIATLIQRAHNLSSLLIHQHFAYGFDLCIEDICCIISRHVRHLQVPINDLHDIKMILERCSHLSSIQFDIRQSKFSKEIVRWLADNTIDSTYRTDHSFVMVWLGKNKVQSSEFSVEPKRIKLTEHS